MSSSAAGGTEGSGAGTYVPPRSMGKMVAIMVALLIVTNVITGVAVYYVAQPAAGVGTVQVIGPWAGVEWSKFKPVLDKFHNDTGIPYQYTTSRQEDLSPTLPISFQAGQSPADLIFMPSATIKQYATRNWVTELTGTLSPTSYQPGALDPLTVSGKIWGGAYTGKVKPGFWYNTSFFTAHSLQKPTSWQGFWSLLSDIKNITGGPAILSGDTDGWPLSDATEAFIETYGGANMQGACEPILVLDRPERRSRLPNLPRADPAERVLDPAAEVERSGGHQPMVERHDAPVLHGELDHRDGPESGQYRSVLVAVRRLKPGDGLRGGLFLRPEVRGPHRSGKASRHVPRVGGRADGPSGGWRSHRDRGGCSYFGLSGA